MPSSCKCLGKCCRKLFVSAEPSLQHCPPVLAPCIFQAASILLPLLKFSITCSRCQILSGFYFFHLNYNPNLPSQQRVPSSPLSFAQHPANFFCPTSLLFQNIFFKHILAPLSPFFDKILYHQQTKELLSGHRTASKVSKGLSILKFRLLISGLRFCLTTALVRCLQSHSRRLTLDFLSLPSKLGHPHTPLPQVICQNRSNKVLQDASPP